jgi:hypothetical protein
MVSDKSLYWIAAVVLVFGFGHRQFCGHDDLASRVKDRVALVANRVSRQADQLLATAEFPFEERNTPIARSQAKMAHAQQRLTCIEATMARRQADFALFQARRARLVAMEQIHRGAFHPIPNFVVNLPQVNLPKSPVVIDGGGTL